MSINPRQLAILQAVREQGSVKTEALAEQFGMTLQTTRRDIQRLTEAAMLERFHGGVRVVDSHHLAYVDLGSYWRGLDALCTWGGTFRSPDGCHFSVRYGGRA